MCERNFSYKDIITHQAILPLKITIVLEGGFEKYLKEFGKTGLQQKIPHIQNDYQLAGRLKEIVFSNIASDE